MDLADFDYDLPEQAIAQVPMEPRDHARLLVDRGPDRPAEHRVVADLPELIRPGDVLVVNTTRVLPARLQLHKDTGGAVEVLLLERSPAGTWQALVRPSRRVPPGTRLAAGDDLTVEIAGPGHEDGTRQVRLHIPDPGTSPAAAIDRAGEAPASGSGVDRAAGAPATGSGIGRAAEGRGDVGHGEPGSGPRHGGTVEASGAGASDVDVELAVLARYGVVPLPPYITAPLADPERYQTVFAERPESVAAPTAGLHLTPAVLDRCREAGATVVPVELAVGLGTFRPMTAPHVEDHHMHAERYRVPETTVKACRDARERGHRVVAVGTTAVRALEATASGELEGRTELFIRRPFDWQVVDVLLTNFHLPRSSLLVLVDAFVGPRWRQLYDTALADGYRFLSFGDAMLLERR